MCIRDSLQTVHGGGKGLFVYVKGQVAVVQVQGLEGRIVHHGGNTVGTGAAKEADEARMPGDGMFHISLQIDLMKLLYQRREKIATAADLWYTHGKGPPGRRKIIVKEEQKQMKLDQHIFLIGFMGCGKSTCAACLCRMTGAEQIEMDQELSLIHI